MTSQTVYNTQLQLPVGLGVDTKSCDPHQSIQQDPQLAMGLASAKPQPVLTSKMQRAERQINNEG